MFTAFLLAVKRSIRPIENINEVSFTKDTDSLQIAGRLAFKACGKIIFLIALNFGILKTFIASHCPSGILFIPPLNISEK